MERANTGIVDGLTFRNRPHTILTFVFMEKLQDFVNWRAASALPVKQEIKI